MAESRPSSSTQRGAYEHRGTRAIQRMVEYAPSTGGLALWVRHQDLAEGGAHRLVATDGKTLFYGAAFEALSVAAQAGLVAHEVLHIALRHPQRFLDLQRLLGDVDLKLFTICADAIVNSALAHSKWLELPASSVHLDQLLKNSLSLDQPVEKALLEWDVERLYRAIDDREPPKKGSRKDGRRAARARAIGQSSEVDLLPGAEAEGPPEAEAEQAREWSERILRGHAGDGAHSMLRTLIADVPKSRTPWEQILRTLLCRSLSQRPSLSWSRPSRSYIANQGRAGPHRRMPWEPGRSANRSVPRLVVIVDVSGSIKNELMERFAREVEAITRRMEAALVVVIGDDHVRRVDFFEPGRSDLRDIEFTGARKGVGFQGGGGTDFTPLLEEADKHRPDIGLVLTDLEGPARFRPAWPVIWAVPENDSKAPQPFGRKLVLG